MTSPRLHAIAKRITAAGLILAALLGAPAGSRAQVRDKEKLQQTKQKLEEEIRQTTDLLNRTRKSKETSLNRIQILTKQIRSREALITAINRELNDMQANMAADSLQINRLTRQLDGMKSEYARMICQAYRTMNGKNLLAFLFSSSDFNQAYRRMQYYRQYSVYRRNQALRMAATRRTIDAHRMELAAAAGQKQVLVRSKQQEKQQLDNEKTQKTRSIKELSSQEKKLLSTLKTKQQAARQLEQAISKLIADEMAAREKAKKKKETTREAAGDRTLSSSFQSNRGKLPWPCDKGLITGSFGEHPHPVLEHVKVKNNGVDIMTDKGASVKAVFGGKVSRVMAFSGINNVIILRHGDYLTVYSNLADVSVREGQDVTVRQVIGRVHDSPGEAKSELHFELWKGKEIQDPERWLSRR
ncbi:MAG TPA: peptidoglycan DD-metalloendopeptidase family protein [Bacteroidales bacterium]|nr:peptidoglycan DD-metalloendopeptidase family protein [Bacteroidales bacterium]HPS61714.1 peptidoglycan DD-metalloendopeptidase family protein [Bacteroidales bacterium]